MRNIQRKRLSWKHLLQVLSSSLTSRNIKFKCDPIWQQWIWRASFCQVKGWHLEWYGSCQNQLFNFCLSMIDSLIWINFLVWLSVFAARRYTGMLTLGIRAHFLECLSTSQIFSWCAGLSKAPVKLISLHFYPFLCLFWWWSQVVSACFLTEA